MIVGASCNKTDCSCFFQVRRGDGCRLERDAIPPPPQIREYKWLRRNFGNFFVFSLPFEVLGAPGYVRFVQTGRRGLQTVPFESN
jgi:hypothetical protein